MKTSLKITLDSFIKLATLSMVQMIGYQKEDQNELTNKKEIIINISILDHI